ncbi:hypothetical protein C1893_10595 [Pseudomonas sp. MPR-ANC1]|uniref:GGDEF domain-containing protein n=1 Tax=Pseudomonas sp. MPR-ANC1 TaxID=2075548 RepID=UPI000CD2EE0D|nr:sensor domain-containing diguanylate cyclase [Pseudomonas sp. MPR-ANC1]POA48301.1 hypothetical protein C1893_10595 [Pseudomonas sp. MPR-ANC1]
MNSLYFSPLLLGINVLAATAVACTALWYYARPYRGPGVWACGVLTLVLGLLLSLGYMAGHNPLLNITGAALQLAGEALLAVGVFRFLGRPAHWWIVPTSAAAGSGVVIWHSWVMPINSEFLVAIYSALSASPLALAARALWRATGEQELRSVRRFVAIALGALALVTVLSGIVGLIEGLNGVNHAEVSHSVAYLLPLNFGIPFWVMALVGLALLTMRRILRDSQQHADNAVNSAARFERLMNISSAGVVLLNEQRIVDANPIMEALFARTHQALLGQPLSVLFAPEDSLALQLQVADGERHDRRAIRADGSDFAAELNIAALDDGNLVAEIRDVSERKKLEDELRRLATRDPLTGALNRRAFTERAESELARSKRHGSTVCLAVFDLDHFKRINDNYGHATGDQVLQRFSQLCQEQLRTTDIFARFGGEEFVLLLPDSDEKQAVVLLDRLRTQWVEEALQTPQGILHSTVSIGLVETGAGQDLEHWIEQADLALYRAKKSGRNRVSL